MTPATTPPDRTTAPVRRRLGRGRSGTVYEERGDDGARWACKVLVPDRASAFVMTVLTGAVNPYRWNADAIETATLRRRILEPLVGLWFQGRVRLPRTGETVWNDDARAYELKAELIDGRHAMLRHPGCGDAKGEVRELKRDVLRPLQRHLKEAGFDGLLWQAGKGNPVATANFMRDLADDAPARWVWIDAESGVPALFPLNPWHLFATYLPLSVKHGRWLFDDVDVERLRSYVASRLGDLSPPAADQLQADVAALAAAQSRWKALGRHGRSVTSHHKTGRIDDAQAEHYRTRPLRWMGRLLVRGIGRGFAKLGLLLAYAFAHLKPRLVQAAVSRWLRFFLSQKVRERWASRYVRRRVVAWRERRFLSRDRARAIRDAAGYSDAAEYVADFGMHLVIKIPINVVRYVGVPVLFATNVIESGWVAAGLFVFLTPACRTLYTLFRTVQSIVRGRRPPLVALVVGPIPTFGNAAYPLQLLAASSTKDGALAPFLVHDIFSATGRGLPIWGGRDTLMEHRTNALATLFARG